MNRNASYRKLTGLLTLCLLLVGLVSAAVLWLRAQRRQYALNRQLIAALVKSDTGKALALVNAGADPNTRYTPPPAPSLKLLLDTMLHRSNPTALASYGPTAFMIACGDSWPQSDHAFVSMNAPDDARLTAAMIAHGADVNAREEQDWTPLVCALQR